MTSMKNQVNHIYEHMKDKTSEAIVLKHQSYMTNVNLK